MYHSHVCCNFQNFLTFVVNKLNLTVYNVVKFKYIFVQYLSNSNGLLEIILNLSHIKNLVKFKKLLQNN